MKGKLVVIEGLDGTGKETQSKLLYKNLLEMGAKVKMLSFPNYSGDSSFFVKKYLNGEIDKDPNKVNAYSATVFFAIDRYISYIQEWKKYYDEGYILICDRYTVSNIIYQTSKFTDADDRIDFMMWAEDFEYEKLQLPRPDIIVFLKLDEEVSDKLISERYKDNDGSRDIHETVEFQKQCSSTLETAFISYQDISTMLICNDEEGNLYPKEEISKDVIDFVLSELENEE